jgi:hypothetical protein
MQRAGCGVGQSIFGKAKPKAADLYLHPCRAFIMFSVHPAKDTQALAFSSLVTFTLRLSPCSIPL